MIRANYAQQGLDIGHNNVNMTYLYGLGDFFHLMFKDTSVVNLLLQANSETASETYSKFLQLTSTLSLEDIQETLGCAIKLALVSSADRIPGTVTEYYLPSNIVTARYVANRPLLPTELLETDVDFALTQEDGGRCRIAFAKDIDSYAVSSRLMPDGTTQYALWFVDAHIDEKVVSEYYGNLIGLDPENSSEQFANFVYGLYYVYTNGPTLTNLRKGLNLTLGIPLARMPEKVIDIRTYLQTDQYIVVTDQNQYLIPYGLKPSVEVGSELQIGDELAQWVEIKDYLHDGEWWTNLYIPRDVIPSLPSGQTSRYATEGSVLDYIMREYLKKHTFLVNVNVDNFKNVQQFTQLGDIIRRAKPAYTQPIYVWSVRSDGDQDDFEVEDELETGLSADWEEDLNDDPSGMRRDLSEPLLRGTSRHIRFNCPDGVKNPIGMDDYTNSSNLNVEGNPIQGFSNSVSLFRTNTREEAAWVDTINNRCSDTWRGLRNQVGYRRRLNISDAAGGSWFGDHRSINDTSVDGPDSEHRLGIYGHSVTLSSVFSHVPEGGRVVPITVMSQDELELKYGLQGLTPPGRYEHTFIIGAPAQGPGDLNLAINDYAINDFGYSPPQIFQLYPDFFQRDSDLPYSTDLNSYVERQFMPPKSDLTFQDVLVGFRINCDVVAIVLISFNDALSSPSAWPVTNELDRLEISVDSSPSRGMAPHLSPYYLLRGSLNYRHADLAINDYAIDYADDVGSPEFLYEDAYNQSAPRTRGGTTLMHRITQ